MSEKRLDYSALSRQACTSEALFEQVDDRPDEIGGGRVTDGSDLIVNFDRPPVVEVVAGVAFDGLTAEASPYLSAFWGQALRSKFPKIEQQPPYSPPREIFGTTRPSGTHPGQFEFITGVPPTRLWASSLGGDELIQLQPGWFACNWRKMGVADTYDHWPARRKSFETSFRQFSEFVTNEGIGATKLTQCEVTYINHILPNELWTKHCEADRIFTFAGLKTTQGAFEQFSCTTQFALLHEGQQYGRLHVSVAPAFQRDGRTPLYVLELTARGPVPSSGDEIAGATEFLDRGREAIVNTFVQVTRDKMQTEVWGKRS